MTEALNYAWVLIMPKQDRSLVVQSGSHAQGSKTEGPTHHRFGDSAVIDAEWIRGRHVIISVRAKATSNARESRVPNNCGPRHDGELSFIGVMFRGMNGLHVCSRLLPEGICAVGIKQMPLQGT